MKFIKMNQTYGYIYVRFHESYEKYNACKLGKTQNIPDRDTQYATGEIKRGYFEAVFEVPIEELGRDERLLQNEFRELNVKYDAGTEFYNKQIIELIEPYLIKEEIKYRKLKSNQISHLIRCYRITKITNKINIQSLIHMLKSKRRNEKYSWNEREYQTTIIEYCKESLKLNNKIYIELPTGGGKSYIVYNLFNHLKSNFILIVSPRKIVNEQNIKTKYLSILSETYKIFNYSNDDNFEEFIKFKTKKIVVCCTKSFDKIYNKLIDSNIINILVWFDEAHWAIEDWINEPNKKKLLEDNKYIKDCIFTSASPNKSIVNKNNHIFGELYSAIKVKELITLDWLANIESYIYSENKENINNCKYLITDFVKKDRKFGFSFHNKQQNAFNLFYNHYTEYINDKTKVKPFLLVSDFNSDQRLIEIQLDYNFRNIKTFENNPNSIGYVVAQYSMGYDFNNIDFISISDPKLSVKDIIQSIGRGIRPDQLGINGSNKYKKLILSLPDRKSVV